MIGAFVVIGALALAGLFVGAWLLWPALRREVEAPKLGFAERVRQYDRECRPAGREQES